MKKPSLNASWEVSEQEKPELLVSSEQEAQAARNIEHIGFLTFIFIWPMKHHWNVHTKDYSYGSTNT